MIKYFAFENIHSVRLFPKNSGPSGYDITGIAAKCDWKILSDTDGSAALFDGDIGTPRTVFVSLRGGASALKFFYEKVLIKISNPFVMISGSEDITLPRQLDRRFPPFSDDDKSLLEKIRSDPRVLVWFAENLDSYCQKMRPMPTGYVFGGSGRPIDFVEVSDIPLANRSRKVFCCHRERAGIQWSARKKVSELCRSEWSSFSTFVERELPINEYMHYVRAHPFTLCVEGGGLDPSPKAWLSLALGSIPIMRKNPTTDIYANSLPVVQVESWDQGSINTELMESWIKEFRPWVECEEFRKVLEFRLSKTYWWNRIELETGPIMQKI